MTGDHKRMAASAARFEALDGLRGLCALMVVMLHLPISGFLYGVPLIRHSFLFVDFFFVLSGFVIAHSYGDRLRTGAEFRRFAGARLRRVYPLHLAMLLLFLAFETAALLARGPGAAFQDGNSVSALLANLFLVHAFGTVSGLGWNYPSWSISAELGTYLLFAGGMILLGARRLAPVLPAIAALALAALVILVGHMDTTVEFGWLRCLAGFSLGAFLRLALMPGIGRAATAGRRPGTAAEAAAIAGVVLFVSLAGDGPTAIAAPLVFTAAVAVFAFEGGLVSRILKSREARFLGLVSYSVYMTQAFVISRLMNVAGIVEGRTGLDLVLVQADGSKVFSPVASPLAATLAVLGTLAFSALTHRFIERPGQRLRLAPGPAERPSRRRALAER